MKLVNMAHSHIGIFGVLIALAGCAQEPPHQTVRIISVPSSAPYKFLTFSQKDDPATIRGIKAHNRAHQTVIDAEKKQAGK